MIGSWIFGESRSWFMLITYIVCKKFINVFVILIAWGILGYYWDRKRVLLYTKKTLYGCLSQKQMIRSICLLLSRSLRDPVLISMHAMLLVSRRWGGYQKMLWLVSWACRLTYKYSQVKVLHFLKRKQLLQEQG